MIQNKISYQNQVLKKKLSFWANHYVNFLRISILFFCKSLSIEYIYSFSIEFLSNPLLLNDKLD